MADVDLIPQEYRYWLWQRSYLIRMGLAALVFLLLAVGAWMAMRMSVVSLQDDLVALEQEQNRQRLLQSELSGIAAATHSVQSRLQLLSGLRGGANVQATLVAIDQALPGDSVWFTDLDFSRQQVLMPSNDLPLPKGAASLPVGAQRLALAVTVSVEGQASDHAALSAFVDQLREQEIIAAVKLLNTSSDSESVIDFALSVHMHAEQEVAGDA
jgi:Tfp pilus assembly protein PilN